MRISGVSGQMTQMGQTGGIQASDQESKNLQRQITEKQKQLQELSTNQELSVEEKMKKRQDIQKEITELNNQLRQHQIELRKEQQQAKGSAMDDMLGGNRKAKAPESSQQEAGLSQAGMKAMLTADSAMDQAQVKGSVAADMEGKAGVLDMEIKMDAARGQNVEKKQEELAEVEKRAQAAIASQASSLAQASASMEEAAKEAGSKQESAEEEEADRTVKEPGTESPATAQEEIKPELYVPIDIRL